MSGSHPFAIDSDEEFDDSASDGPVFDASRVNEISANAKAFEMGVFHSKTEMRQVMRQFQQQQHQQQQQQQQQQHQQHSNRDAGLPPVPTVDELMKQYNLPSFARLTTTTDAQGKQEPLKNDLKKASVDERREAFQKRLEEKAAVLMEELKVDKQTAKALLARADCSLEDSKVLCQKQRVR